MGTLWARTGAIGCIVLINLTLYHLRKTAKEAETMY